MAEKRMERREWTKQALAGLAPELLKLHHEIWAYAEPSSAEVQSAKLLCEVLRQKGTPYDELGLAGPQWSDAQLLDFMLQHPILINRPIVVTPLGTRLCRPSELVLDLLPQPQRGAFTKEDGEAVVDAQGVRVAKP